MTDVRKVLKDVLARDAELARSGAKNDCNCIFLSREAEQEYETGTCPHQRARQFLSTLATEQVGEEEIAEIIWNVSAKWLEKELSHVGLTPRPFSKADDRERRLHLDYARAILSRPSLREGLSSDDKAAVDITRGVAQAMRTRAITEKSALLQEGANAIAALLSIVDRLSLREGVKDDYSLHVTDASVALADCPIGLFLCNGELCLKTEYGDNDGRIDAYIVSSGEFFWGEAKTKADQRKVLVTPVEVSFPLHPYRSETGVGR